MSLTSKVTFTVISLTTVGTIVYVHYKQQYDREQVHLGVVRDLEQLERRKRENLYVLQKQVELGRQLQKEEKQNLNT